MAEAKKQFEGRCMRCKAQKKIKDPVATEIKPGTWAVKGKCVDCDCNMFKIIGKTKPEC
jgi:hypothetical protein